MMVVFAEILDAYDRLDQTNDDDFEKIVQQVIDEKVDITEAAKRSSRLGKTAKQLNDALEYITSRRNDRAIADELRRREVNARKAAEALDECQRAWGEAEKTHAQEVTVLAEIAYSAQRLVGESYAANQRLRKSYRGPLLAKLSESHELHRQLNEDLTELQRGLKLLKWNLSGPLASTHGREARENMRRRQVEHETAIAETQRQIAECQREAERIEKQMLEV
jgi:hypothetical protein